MNRTMATLLTVSLATALHAGASPPKQAELFCHRTANTEMPENTLESIALAARMGCNVVEIDVHQTLDGKLVLNHDGYLDRLTNGTGIVEQTSSDELNLLDAGAWMGQRFTNMRIPSFEDILELAREQGIKLILDMKTKGEGPLVLAALKRHGMLEQVTFGGEWNDIRALYPTANSQPTKYLPPGSTADQISALQHAGNFVVVNFSANPHEMDLPSMRAAVAAGADAINVDYPRLGADAIGRPVEAKLATFARTASDGPIPSRTAAIRELSYYQGFPTQQLFLRWLRDPNDQVSRAAAVALVLARPQTSMAIFVEALAAPQSTARKNAAWALGITGAPATASLLPLLKETDPELLKEVLLALSRCPGDVPAASLTPFLASDVPLVRATAALALARHQPQAAAQSLPVAFDHARKESTRVHSNHGPADGLAAFTQQEIDAINDNYREKMKLTQAIEQLPPGDALPLLAAMALHPADETNSMLPLVAGYQLWDRIAANPTLAIQALSSPDLAIANRAEWVLVQAGPSVLPAVRESLRSATPPARDRLIRILAWQGDSKSLPLLHELQQSNPQNTALIDWAIQKIQTLSFNP
jgi:glycerophosphoryl diester phosphodiesterase/HEAT repeat protein